MVAHVCSEEAVGSSRQAVVADLCGTAASVYDIARAIREGRNDAAVAGVGLGGDTSTAGGLGGLLISLVSNGCCGLLQSVHCVFVGVLLKRHCKSGGSNRAPP